MASVQTAKRSPQSKKEADIKAEAGVVKTNMTGNANYSGTATVALLTTYGTALTDYQTKSDAAADGGKALKKAKNAAKKVFLKAWKALANNVNDVTLALNITIDAMNAMLATTGFPLISTNRTAQPLPTPENLRAEYPNAGILVIRVNTIVNARLYRFMYRENGTTNAWAVAPKIVRKNASVTLMAQSGQIQSGKKYDIQAVALGADPTENMSAIFTTDYVR